MKKGRSKKNKITKYRERAMYYLENYFWEKEEEVLLKLLSETEIPLMAVRDLGWNKIDLLEKKIRLRKEDVELNQNIMTILKEFAEIKIPDEMMDETCENIFDHDTFKKINLELDNFKK